MVKQCRQVTVYLDDVTFNAISAAAKSENRSLSSHLKAVIETEIGRSRHGISDLRRTQEEILIGVNALLKHHTNPKLFDIVKMTQASVLGGASDGR